MTDRRLFFWGARGLYIGPAFGLRPHRNAVAVLCVSLDGPSRLANNPRSGTDGHTEFGTALVPPNTLHHLCIPEGHCMAFLYVDALSRDHAQLRATMQVRQPRFAISHPGEKKLIETLRALASGARWQDTRDSLLAQLGLSDARCPDPRIAEALARLRTSPDDRHSLSQAAHHARLSPSHFLHVFKNETGVPFRRYRLWTRMGAALKAIRAGSSLTEAAYAAGFSSSAHFSASFTEMFGLPPSRLHAGSLSGPTAAGNCSCISGPRDVGRVRCRQERQRTGIQTIHRRQKKGDHPGPEPDGRRGFRTSML